MNKDKKEWLYNRGLHRTSIYIPEPGIPIDSFIEIGDQVLVNICILGKRSSKYSACLDSQFSNSCMYEKNKKWLKVVSVREAFIYHSKKQNPVTLYELEGNFYSWQWHHFSAVRKRNGSYLISPFEKEKSYLPEL